MSVAVNQLLVFGGVESTVTCSVARLMDGAEGLETGDGVGGGLSAVPFDWLTKQVWSLLLGRIGNCRRGILSASVSSWTPRQHTHTYTYTYACTHACIHAHMHTP